MPGRPRNPKGWDDLLRLIAAMAFVIRTEADHLEKNGADREASDVGKMTVAGDDPTGGHATTAYVLRSIAAWIDELVESLMR